MINQADQSEDKKAKHNSQDNSVLWIFLFLLKVIPMSLWLNIPIVFHEMCMKMLNCNEVKNMAVVDDVVVLSLRHYTVYPFASVGIVRGLF